MKRFIIFVFSFFVLLCSCSSDFTMEEKDDFYPEYVNLNTAKSKVLSMLEMLYGETKSEGGRTISDCFTIGRSTKSGLEEPIYHIFNFSDNNGFAVASGDIRTPEIFCITEQGHLSNIDDIDNPGFDVGMKLIDLYYRVHLGLPVYGENGEEVDSSLLDGLYMGDYQFDPDTLEYYFPTEHLSYSEWLVESRIGDIIPTEWGQSSPFNKYCFTSGGLQAKVGCVAVATGQIMYHHAKNWIYNTNNYDWNTMAPILNENCDTTTYVVGWDLVQHLLADLGRPENLNMSYGVNGSGALSYNINRTFSNFGYSNTGTWSNYNNSSILSQIAQGPVYMRGECNEGGHAWVADEAITRWRIVTVYPSDDNLRYSYEQRDNLLHINWGWYGDADGYYYPGIFDVSQGPVTIKDDSQSPTGLIPNFNVDLEVCYGISPR